MWWCYCVFLLLTDSNGKKQTNSVKICTRCCCCWFFFFFFLFWRGDILLQRKTEFYARNLHFLVKWFRYRCRLLFVHAFIGVHVNVVIIFDSANERDCAMSVGYEFWWKYVYTRTHRLLCSILCVFVVHHAFVIDSKEARTFLMDSCIAGRIQCDSLFFILIVSAAVCSNNWHWIYAQNCECRFCSPVCVFSPATVLSIRTID